MKADLVLIRPASVADIPAFARYQMDVESAYAAAFIAPAALEERVARWAQIVDDPDNLLRAVTCAGEMAGYVGTFGSDQQGVGS